MQKTHKSELQPPLVTTNIAGLLRPMLKSGLGGGLLGSVGCTRELAFHLTWFQKISSLSQNFVLFLVCRSFYQKEDTDLTH